MKTRFISTPSMVIALLILFMIFIPTMCFAGPMMPVPDPSGCLYTGVGAIVEWFISDYNDTVAVAEFSEMMASLDPVQMPSITFFFRDGHIESGFLSVKIIHDQSGKKLAGYAVVDASGGQRRLNPDEIGFVYLPETGKTYIVREEVMLREPGFCIEGGVALTISPFKVAAGGGYLLRLAFPLSLNSEAGLELSALLPSGSSDAMLAGVGLDGRWYLDRYRRGFFLEPSLSFGYVAYVGSGADFDWTMGLSAKIGYTLDLGLFNAGIAAGWQESLNIQDRFANSEFDGHVLITAKVGMNFAGKMPPQEYIDRDRQRLPAAR